MSGQLSSREKTLSILVGTVVFVAFTFFAGDYFLKNKARLTAALSLKARQLKAMQMRSADKAVWDQRAVWLLEKQPKLGDEQRAAEQLRETVKELAKKHQVLIESSDYLPAARKPDLRKPDPYTAIGIKIGTKSDWSALIRFLGELQTPEQFIALESADLKIDETDPTKMHGDFKIARWYAPK